MSNVNPSFHNLSLDPAEMIAVSEAYGLACRTLQRCCALRKVNGWTIDRAKDLLKMAMFSRCMKCSMSNL